MAVPNDFFADFKARLGDVRSLAEQMAVAVGEIEKAAEAGRYPVPPLVLAQALVGVDAVAGELARVSDRLGNAADPALLRQRGKGR